MFKSNQTIPVSCQFWLNIISTFLFSTRNNVKVYNKSLYICIWYLFQDVEGAAANDPISDLFAEQFSDELAREFEDAMKGFLADDPKMMQEIEKLAEAAGNSGWFH